MERGQLSLCFPRWNFSLSLPLTTCPRQVEFFGQPEEVICSHLSGLQFELLRSRQGKRAFGKSRRCWLETMKDIDMQWTLQQYLQAIQEQFINNDCTKIYHYFQAQYSSEHVLVVIRAGFVLDELDGQVDSYVTTMPF